MDHLQEVHTAGYAVLPNLISDADCDRYKALLERDYANFAGKYVSNSNPAGHGLDNKEQEKVVYNLHNKSHEWYKLFLHPQVLRLLDGVLKPGSYKGLEPYYLYNISARCPLKGNPGQQLHSDSRLPGLNHCIVANVLWALDDFTKQNGATRVVPGSHRFMNFAEDGKVYEQELLVTAKKGSAIVFNANLWHGGGGNLDGSSRWAVALGYARWFIKPSFDYMKNMPREMYDLLSHEEKLMLGYCSVPPKDEFTRVRRRSDVPEIPDTYQLPD